MGRHENAKQKSVLPLIADESCLKLEDVSTCAEVFHGINIKLMKCGGITPALQMIQIAKAKHFKIMAGCMTESSIGISNLVQLAPLPDYIDADGAFIFYIKVMDYCLINFFEVDVPVSVSSVIKYMPCCKLATEILVVFPLVVKTFLP